MAKTLDLKPGDKVFYRGSWGAGAPMKGTIVWSGFCEDKGCVIVDVELASGEMRWGYPDQFTKI